MQNSIVEIKMQFRRIIHIQIKREVPVLGKLSKFSGQSRGQKGGRWRENDQESELLFLIEILHDLPPTRSIFEDRI